MLAEEFQFEREVEGIPYSFHVACLKKGLNFHYVVRPETPRKDLKCPQIHVRPAVCPDEHWHFTCGNREQAANYYSAELLELVGNEIDRFNLKAML